MIQSVWYFIQLKEEFKEIYFMAKKLKFDSIDQTLTFIGENSLHHRNLTVVRVSQYLHANSNN